MIVLSMLAFAEVFCLPIINPWLLIYNIKANSTKAFKKLNTKILTFIVICELIVRIYLVFKIGIINLLSAFIDSTSSGININSIIGLFALISTLEIITIAYQVVNNSKNSELLSVEWADIVSDWRTGGITTSEAAAKLKVSINTFHKKVNRYNL